jgi:multiple sugar transport system substrate-binding protein
MNRAALKIGAAVAAVAVTVSACGGSGGSGGGGAATDANPASVKGTLRVLVPSYPASNEGKAALQKVVDGFHHIYPNVKVEPDFATFATLQQKIATSIASSQPYDVYLTGVGWIPPFAAKGLFADLSKYGVTADSLTAQVNPAVMPATEYNGKIYAVPLALGPKPLAYSKKAFKAAGLDPNKPPTSWATLRADTRKLTERDSSGAITKAGFDFWAPPGGYRQDFVTFLGSKGVALYDNGKPTFNGPEGTAALDTMAAMIKTDKVTTYGAASSDGQPLVFEGKAAMGFAGGYVDCAKVGKNVCDDLGFFNLQESTPAMYSGGQLASVGANSKLSAAAYAFVQALSKPQAETDIAKLNFAIPAAKAAATSTVVTGNPASTFAATHLSEIVLEGGNARWLDVRNQFNTALDKALLGSESSKSVLDTLAKSG